MNPLTPNRRDVTVRFRFLFASADAEDRVSSLPESARRDDVL